MGGVGCGGTKLAQLVLLTNGVVWTIASVLEGTGSGGVGLSVGLLLSSFLLSLFDKKSNSYYMICNSCFSGAYLNQGISSS